MGIDKDVVAAARASGASHEVCAATLLAIALVETDAVAFAAVQGRPEPLIRFEGHYFDRRLAPDKREIARLAGLAHPRAGAVRNPVGQGARWALLHRAFAIDRVAAIESTSWGLGQVMGAHWPALGLAGAEALAEAARASAEGQFALVARFLKANALDGLLPAGDWRGFARRYNGPGFAANRYDTKIATAFRHATAALAPLSRGARGPAVVALQRALGTFGAALAPDGIFGPLTHRALLAFQRARGLVPSGVLDPQTGARLGL